MKTQLTATDLTTDFKMLLVGHSGAGKTHLTGTYKSGPIHYYMVDPGGEKTLFKLLEDRPKESPITIDTFRRRDKQDFNQLWETMQKDAAAGFYDNLKKQNGLLVIDSMTSVIALATDAVAKLSGKKPGLSPEKGGFRRQEFGIRSGWILELIRQISDIPCATILCCHLQRIVDDNTGTVTESLLMPGQNSDVAGNWFDEVWKLSTIGKTLRISFKPDGKFESTKSRVFSLPYADFQMSQPTLDQLAKAYIKGGDLSEIIKQPKTATK